MMVGLTLRWREGGGERGNKTCVYPRILGENVNIKGKVSSSPEGSMVIEAISAKGKIYFILPSSS